MDQKFRFASRHNTDVVVLMDSWDVPEMVKNSHDWLCLDDVSRILLGSAADAVLSNIPAANVGDVVVTKTLTVKKSNGNREDLA